MHWAKASLLRLLSFQSTSVRRPSLFFTPNGTFQLSIFEDLHYGEAEDLWWGPQQDINSTRVMNTILDIEQQQLVVLNGDLITGENTFKPNSTDYINRIVEPLLQRGLPWASTYGNHDSEFNLSRHNILKREQTWPNALTQQMVNTPTSGVSNYYLPVYANESSPSSTHPELILWFFDSRGGNFYQQQTADDNPVPQDDWVDASVVDWFNRTNAALQHGAAQPIPSLAFVHIPIEAMRAFQQANPGVRPHREPGINDDDPLAQQGQGSNDTYAAQDEPFMRALLATAGLRAVFSGHDHGDDWCARWDRRLPGMQLTGNGLHLCFGRHSGYGGYGSWTRGSRQVRVSLEPLRAGAPPPPEDAQPDVETWVRLETGEVTGRVTLNSTYGRDVYPAVPDTST